MTLYDIVWHSVTNDAFCDNYQCDGSLWQIHTISFCGAIIDCAGDGGTGLQNIMSAALRSSTRYCPGLAPCSHWCVLNWIGCMLHRQRVGPIVTAEVFLAYNFPFKTASSSLHAGIDLSAAAGSWPRVCPRLLVSHSESSNFNLKVYQSDGRFYSPVTFCSFCQSWQSQSAGCRGWTRTPDTWTQHYTFTITGDALKWKAKVSPKKYDL